MLSCLLRFLNSLFFAFLLLIFLLNNNSFNQLHKSLKSIFDHSLGPTEKAIMNTLNPVDIDTLGRFKYLQFKVLDPATQETKIIVRGFGWASYHYELSENFERILNLLKVNNQVPENLVFSILGGGRIYHNPDKSTIKVYGYSEAYGKADHELTANMIREKFPNYSVTWSDDGY